MDKTKNKTIWYWARGTFYGSLLLWVISVIFDPEANNLALGLVWVGSVVASFVLSIIHLIRYEKKGFAITALSISSFVIFLFFIGILAGIIQGLLWE